MIHPHNKNYVLLLDELDQNARSFYIPTVLECEFYVNYTDAITETTSEDVYTDVKNNKLNTEIKFIPDYELLDEE